MESSVVEVDYKYRNCCGDEKGVYDLNFFEYQKSSCSLKKCFFSSLLSHTIWTTEKLFPGCDCCEYNNELIMDGYSWTEDGKTFECCRGEIVIKVQTEQFP